MALSADSHSRDLTDEQWLLIGPFMPKLARRTDGRGRPWRENRAVLNGILWILRTGAPWADLADRYPSYQTCHRRFQQWVRAGVLRGVLEVLAQTLHDEGYLDLQVASSTEVSRRQAGRYSVARFLRYLLLRRLLLRPPPLLRQTDLPPRRC